VVLSNIARIRIQQKLDLASSGQLLAGARGNGTTSKSEQEAEEIQRRG